MVKACGRFVSIGVQVIGFITPSLANKPSCFAREVISVPRLQTFNEPSHDGRIGSKGGRDE